VISDNYSLVIHTLDISLPYYLTELLALGWPLFQI
jgi:hypothetical protein